MKRLITFLLLFAAIKVAGQTTGYLRFDTVMIYKVGGTAELVLMNKTKDTLGILTNYGNGRTRFMKSRAINDSTIVVGLDTLVIRGATGGGIGSGDTTYVQKPLIVNTGDNDTLAIIYDYGLTIDGDSALIADSLEVVSWERLQKVADSLIALMATAGVPNANIAAGYRWLIPGTQEIKTVSNSATVTWDSTSTANTLTATVPDNAITNAKLAQMAALTVKVNPTNSTANAQDLAFSTDGNVLQRSGTTLITGPVDLAKAGARTGLLPEDNLAAFRTYPTEGTGNWTVLFEQSSWTGADIGAQFQRGANHTITLNGTFPRIASSTIVWGGASLTRFLPNLPIIATNDRIEVDYQIVSALAGNVGFGPSMFSNNVNGANFGYTTYLSASTTTGTPHFAKQDGTSDQTGTTFTIAVNDIIRTTIEFRDTIAVATFQNLTSGSAVTTITKTFTAGVAPYPPNTGTWGFQNFSGTYEIRRIKIMTRKITSPTLMVAFDSKGQIIAAPWDRRFPNLLNARYPTVLNYSGGGDQLKDLIDKRVEFSRLNPEQVHLGLGSNDLRYGSSLATTIVRFDNVAKMLNGSSTRWAVSVVPEDSTAGGLSGLTAFKNWVAATYPSNYIDLWTFMSTSNVLKAAYNSGDGVHPNTEGHRIIDSLTAASGFFTTQSPNRRAPYQKLGGGIWATGDSLYGPFKNFSPNSILRFNDSNQVTHSLAFDNATKFTISANYPHAQTVAATTLFQMDGLQSYTGINGGNLFYDRTNTTNFHTIYSNNNVFRFGYNGTDNFYFDNNGLFAIGTINSGLPYAPTLYSKKNRTLSAGSVDSRGISFVDDTIAVTMPAGSHSNVYGAKFGQKTFTASSAEHMTRHVALFVERSIPSTNVTFTNPYAIYATGRIGTDSTYSAGNMDSTTSATGGFVYRDNVTGNFKLTGAPSGVSQSALNDTAAAIRSAITGGTVNYILQYSGTQAVTVSNNSAETTIYGTGQGSAGIDGTANITAGTRIVLKGSGTIDTDASVAGQVAFNFDIGTTTNTVNLTTLATALNNAYYEYEYVLIPVATGNNQDAIYQLSMYINNNGTPIHQKFTGRFLTSFTTTGTVTCDVTVDWNTADTENNVESNFNTVEIFKK